MHQKTLMKKNPDGRRHPVAEAAVPADELKQAFPPLRLPIQPPLPLDPRECPFEWVRPSRFPVK
jgi:hypothetical protein